MLPLLSAIAMHCLQLNSALMLLLLVPLCAKRGGSRKMLQSAKSNEYISSVGSSWDMFNLEGPHLPYFMAILLPFYGIFWLKMAILGHRQSQRPQMGWTLVEHGWTLYFTSGGVRLDPFGPPKMAFWGPRIPQKWPFLAKKCHIGP